MKTFLARFMKNESGATAIEYGLIAALISIAIIAGVRSIGSKLSTTFDTIQNCIACVMRHATRYAPIHPSQNAALFGPRFICARRLSRDARRLTADQSIFYKMHEVTLASIMIAIVRELSP